MRNASSNKSWYFLNVSLFTSLNLLYSNIAEGTVLVPATYTYDVENRLIQIETTLFTYDADGSRIRKSIVNGQSSIDTRPQRAKVRIDKSLKIVVYICLFLLVATFLLHEIGNDSDIWLHLKAGQYISENHKIPHQEIFSYTISGKEWVNHEWLSQIISYSAYKLTGANGVIILRFAVIMAVLFLLFLLAYNKENYLLTGASILLFILSSQNRFNDRPEMYTLLFMAFYIYVLQKFRGTKVIYLIPLLQLLWANMHGYYILGLIIIFIFLLNCLITRNRNYKDVLWIFALSIIACILNPNGLKGILYPLKTLIDINTTSKIFTNYIDELLPPFKIPTSTFMPYLFWYKILLVASLLSFISNFKRINFVYSVLFILTLAMSMFSQRNIPVFALVASMSLTSNLAQFNVKPKLLRIILSTSLSGLIIVLSYNEITSKYYVFEKKCFKSKLLGISEIRYPISAVNFFKQTAISGPIFNNFYCGSYLIWRLYPQEKVFIDGRTELYGPDFYKYYHDAIENNAALEGALKKYDINCIVFFDPAKESEEVIKWLYKNQNWKLVYFDALSSIFVRANIKNRDIIDKYAIELRNFKLPPFEMKRGYNAKNIYPYQYLNIGKIFAITGLYDKAIESAGVAISIDKKCMPAYNLLGIVYIQKGDYDNAAEVFNNALKIEPKNVRLLYNLGIAYGARGNTDLAIEAYKKAIDIDPKFQSPLFGLVACYKQKGFFDKAKELLLTMRKNDLTGDVHCQLGYLYLREKDLINAENNFSKAAKINSYNAMNYNGLGLIYAKKGMQNKAIESFKKATTLNPRFKEAHDNLGVAYAKNGEYMKAMVEWEEILKIDPNSAEAQQKIEKTRTFLNKSE